MTPKLECSRRCHCLTQQQEGSSRLRPASLPSPRHLIENFFARLKQCRAIATRYDKTARNFLGAIRLAATGVWLA